MQEEQIKILEDFYHNENYTNYHVRMVKLTEFIFNLDIPKDGYIVMLGTFDCVIFNLWCTHFGYDRCIGYDISDYGHKNHPSLRIKDVNDFDESDDFPIAFGHNDLPSKIRGWDFNNDCRTKGDRWLLKNLVSGGHYFTWHHENSDPKLYKDYLKHDEIIKYGMTRYWKNIDHVLYIKAV